MQRKKSCALGVLLLLLVLLPALFSGCQDIPPESGAGLEVVALPSATEANAAQGLENPPAEAPVSGGDVETTGAEAEIAPEAPREDAEYSSPEEVAAYLHLYGRLPPNYLTKSQAEALGWDSRKGNLWDVAPGKSIGGDRFGNREGLLPPGNYWECDVNYAGGYRGAERLIYDGSGGVWYTADHYESFVQFY